MTRARAVFTLSDARLNVGRSLAADLGIPHFDARRDVDAKKSVQLRRYLQASLQANESDCKFAFVYDDAGLSIVCLDRDSLLRARADFHGPTVNYRRLKGGGRRQMIAKAVGLASNPRTRVLDATAGLGRDAFVLASLGCEVIMMERVAEVGVLLDAALKDAYLWGHEHDPDLISILDRMKVVKGDARSLMKDEQMTPSPDVIYLDPMFPHRTKSAQVKQEMRLFQSLVGSDTDGGELLSLALSQAKERVVVKRPRLAPLIDSGASPNHQLEGKRNRFDVYLSS